eukprot:gene3258-3536_t
MERLHILIAIAACLIALRGGFNLLKLFGLSTSTSSTAFDPEHCPDLLHPIPPFQHHNSSEVGYDGAEHLLQWLRGQPGVVLGVSAAHFDELRGLQAWQAFLWAYSIAKTRVVTLHVDEISGETGRKLSQQLAPLDVEDVGVMVPVLDLANHGTASQVFISYNPSDEELPVCSWRWLLEFGFVPGPTTTATGETAAGGGIQGTYAGPDGLPLRQFSKDRQRWCYGMNITVDILLAGCNNSPKLHGRDAPAGDKQGQQLPNLTIRQLEARGIDGSFWMDLDSTGGLPEGLFDWLTAVVVGVDDDLQQQQPGGGGPSSTGGSNGENSDILTVVDCMVNCILESVLLRQQEAVLQAVQALTMQQQDVCAAEFSSNDMDSPKVEDLLDQQRSPETPKLSPIADSEQILSKSRHQAARSIPLQAAKASPKKPSFTASRPFKVPKQRRTDHNGPLIVEDDSKPANFRDLATSQALHPTILLRPPYSFF